MSTAAIRVLVVEDSSTVRRVVSDALNSDRDITVVGTAANGRIGLTEIARLEPDLVTLDIEMPDMDGLTMLTELRRTNPRIPVIMVSTLTGRGASATLDALARGASDYVTKPSSATATSSTSAIEHFRRELVPKVKALCLRRSATSEPRRPIVMRPRPVAPAGTATNTPSTRSALRVARYELLAIGCSTGGPNALEAVLAALPGDFGAPILITQHMPPIFTKMLADRLDQKCALHVVEAAPGMRIESGVAYIAPGDYHLVMKRDDAGMVLATNQNPPENSCRPAVDVMFRSIAEIIGSRTLAIVLTGMGYDGRVGASAIAQSGGEIIAQDEATSVVWGMPGAVAEAGLASEILPIDDMAAAITRRFGRRPGSALVTVSPGPAVAVHAPAPALTRVPAVTRSSVPGSLSRPAPSAPVRPIGSRPLPSRPAAASLATRNATGASGASVFAQSRIGSRSAAGASTPGSPGSPASPASRATPAEPLSTSRHSTGGLA